MNSPVMSSPSLSSPGRGPGQGGRQDRLAFLRLPVGYLLHEMCLFARPACSVCNRARPQSESENKAARDPGRGWQMTSVVSFGHGALLSGNGRRCGGFELIWASCAVRVVG